MSLLDQFGAPLVARADGGYGHHPLAPTAYRGASISSQETYAWRPSTLSADAAVLPERARAAARVDDIARNDPHAVAGVARLVDMLVGAGVRLSAKPDGRALGFDTSTKEGRVILRDLAMAMEAEFRAFAEDPLRRNDAQQRLSLNGQLRLAARTFVRRGEATAFLSWKPRAGGRYATCLRMVDPDRLSNPFGVGDTRKLRGGIAFDDDGMPLTAFVRNGHPGDRYFDGNFPAWEPIPFRTEFGRPVFIHAFEPDREDQARAITPFASLMTRLRMIGKHADTELASATVNALFAAFLKSNLPVSEATQAFTPQGATFAEKRTDYYMRNPPTLMGVRIPVLGLGDEIQINSSPRQSTSFASFQTAFLQSIAASLGISYEQLSMDWSKVNYSSARAALNEVWRHIQLMFAQFVEQFICPIHYAVIEEAFDRGYLKAPKNAPDFYDQPGAYLRARWIGPARGYVDPVKEAEAASMRMDALTSTLERECAEQGLDYEETLDQIANETEMLAERKIERLSARTAPDIGREQPEEQNPQQPSQAPA